MLLILSCKGTQPQDPIVGRWQVTDVIRDGQSIVGRGFQGSYYVFAEDGMVMSWGKDNDTSKVEYAHRGDSLFWVIDGGEEVYLIDSLSESYLRLQVDQDGYSSKIDMRKIVNPDD